MNNKNLKWEVLGKLKNSKTKKLGNEDIVDILLENRGIKTKKQKEEFFNPTPPEKISIKSLNIKEKELSKAIKRIKNAVVKGEDIVIYGDYDADGICSTAILWEELYYLTKNVKPYIPNRFDEGYGINAKSIEKLKIENEKLKIIITVDNGIVANDAVDKANELGIDVIITDHHQPGKKLPKAYSIVHTDKISGSGVAWIFSREIARELKIKNEKIKITNSLELVAIGTIADQLPLLGSNRSFAKYGLEALNNTERPGLLALFEEAGLIDSQTRLRQKATARQVGTYEVNYIIAPRINAMGRMEHAIDSLRLLCTTSTKKAEELAYELGRVNKERQKVLEEVVSHTKEDAIIEKTKGVIFISHETYHEGVIGLAAAKLVEAFWRPAIVVSKGTELSKGSARSIPGISIIDLIRKLDQFTLGGGGHPMAAGFSLKTDMIEKFSAELERLSAPLLTDELLTKRLKIDLEIDFELVNTDLLKKIKAFEPFGIGNYEPVFLSSKVNIIDARLVGSDKNHLKLKIGKNAQIIDAIGFNLGKYFGDINSNKKYDVAFNIEENVWNGNTTMQLRVKDVREHI